MSTVAALYVDMMRGPYPALPDVECWGLPLADADHYAGPHPVVAHPPCGHWGRYHQRAHDDGHSGPIAVAAVRKWGGVLEHPKDSKLWPACGLPKPGELPDEFGGLSFLVYQRDWGHRADKPTWIYVVGLIKIPEKPAATSPVYQPPGRARGILERMSKTTRHLTPRAFAEWLVSVARAAGRGR